MDLFKQCLFALQMGIIGIVFLVLGLSAPGLAAPPANNPGQPFKASDPCEVAPVWGKRYEFKDRFVRVDWGFCDKATGLVWESSPDLSSKTWETAVNHCIGVGHFGSGFHLPTIEQLASLMPFADGIGALGEDDLPYYNVPAGQYWSSTTVAGKPAEAWYVFFAHNQLAHLAPGYVAFTNKDTHDTSNSPGPIPFYAWCVRGGQTYDGQ